MDDFLGDLANQPGDWRNLDFGRISDNENVVGFDNLPSGDLSVMKVYAQQWGGKVRAIDEATDINMPPPQAITQEKALEQVLTRQPSPKPRYTGGHFQEICHSTQ